MRFVVGRWEGVAEIEQRSSGNRAVTNSKIRLAPAVQLAME